ncbi:uncharacterized protein LOC144902789 [Branchiostoma floridae x Branchiostoma belcheri]
MMGKKPPGVLMFLLVILKVLGTAKADCSTVSWMTFCSNQNLTSVPQDLPTTIWYLDLRSNQITTLSQSDFSRYNSLSYLHLHGNHISTINSQAFHQLSDLTNLDLSQNHLTSLRPDMFTGLGNLVGLNLYNNDISDIQAGTFSPTPQLRNLHLDNNHIQTIPNNLLVNVSFLRSLRLSNNNITMFPFEDLSRNEISLLYLDNNQMTALSWLDYDILTSISDVNIDNNPWQCDCRMVDFRLKMNGSRHFENQVNCSQPDNFHGQKLIDINREDLICEAPTIASFRTIGNNPLVQGKPIHLACEASGIPTPDITVILPSGLNVTVRSGGEMNVTAAGLYVCIAVNLAGSTFATLVVELHTVPTTVLTPSVTSPLATTSNSPESTTDLDSATTSFPPPVSVPSLPSKQPGSVPSFSLPVLLAAVCGSVAGTLFIGGIILAIWCKRNNQSPPKRPDFSVVFNNTNTTTTVITNGHNLTGQTQPQPTRPASSQFEPYEEVQPPPKGTVPSQTARGQALRPPNGNSNEPPPVPPPRTASATGYENIPEHAYQPLAVTRNQPDNGQDASHHYQSLRRT